jgi:hypothetical protein
MHGSQPPAPPRVSLTEKSILILNKAAVALLNAKVNCHVVPSYERTTHTLQLQLFSERPPLGLTLKLQATGQMTLGLKKFLLDKRARTATKTQRHDLHSIDDLSFVIS